MRLAHLDPEQRQTLEHLLGLWHSHREVTLDGRLSVRGSEHGYTQVSAARADLGRTVTVNYGREPVEIGAVPGAETVVINATSQPRVVARLTVPAEVAESRSADGSVTSRRTRCHPGLAEVDVPPYGTVTMINT